MKNIIFLATIILIGCKKPDYSVRYEVTCDDCRLEFHNRDGATITIERNVGSWAYEFAGMPGRFVSVSATNKIATGSMKAAVVVGKEELRSESTNIPYGKITASGYLED